MRLLGSEGLVASGVRYLHLLLFAEAEPKYDVISQSNTTVEEKDIPKEASKFVFALREPDCGKAAYFLCVGALSKQSNSDISDVALSLGPSAIVLCAKSSLLSYYYSQLKNEELGVNSVVSEKILDKDSDGTFKADVPNAMIFLSILSDAFTKGRTSSFYERVAENVASRAVFGASLTDNIRCTLKASKSEKSEMLFLLSPAADVSTNNDTESDHPLQSELLLHSQLTSSFVISSNTAKEDRSKGINSEVEYPKFASMLLQSAIIGITEAFPETLRQSAVAAKRCLHSVEKGEKVEFADLKQLFPFRASVEHLRQVIWMNTKAEIRKAWTSKTVNLSMSEFSAMNCEDQHSALMAESLRRLVKSNSNALLVVLEADDMLRLAKFWDTQLASAPNEYLKGVLVNESEFQEQLGIKADSPVSLFSSTPFLRQWVTKQGDETGSALVYYNSTVLGASTLFASCLAMIGLKQAYLSAVLSTFGVKVPTAFKLFALNFKHHFALTGAKAMAPAHATLGAKTAAVSKTSSTNSFVVQAASRLFDNMAQRALSKAIIGGIKSTHSSHRVTGRAFPKVLAGIALVGTGWTAWHKNEVKRTVEMVPSAGYSARLKKGVALLQDALAKLER